MGYCILCGNKKVSRLMSWLTDGHRFYICKSCITEKESDKSSYPIKNKQKESNNDEY